MQSNTWNFCHGIGNEYELHEGIKKLRYSYWFNSHVCIMLCVCVCVLVIQSRPTMQLHGLQAARLLCLWDSSCKKTCHSLLQGIFLTQGSNPGLLHHRQILYHLNQQGSPINPINNKVKMWPKHWPQMENWTALLC